LAWCFVNSPVLAGPPAPRGLFTAFGVALTLCGTILLALAYWRYRRIAADILHRCVRWDPQLGILLSGLIVLAGLLLAAYLLLTGSATHRRVRQQPCASRVPFL
jgi:hypothetical protein